MGQGPVPRGSSGNFRNVSFNQSEIFVGLKMFNVLPLSSQEVIDADDMIVVGEQFLTDETPDESRSASNKIGLSCHWKNSISGLECYTNEPMAKIEIAGAPSEHLATLLAIGLFDQVKVDWRQESFEPTAEQRVQIDERWTPRAEKGYFPGPVARVTDVGIADGSLQLSMQPTTFKEYVGLQSNDDAWRFGIENLANPLSVSMAVLTADKKWVLTKKMRGDRVGSIDAVGGYLNPEKDDNDPRKTATREYSEEIGVPGDSVKQLFFLALEYEFKDLCHPVLSILAESNLPSQDILESAPRNADGEVQLLIVDDPLRTITEMEKQGVDIEPDGQLTFALAGAYWADATIFEKPRVCAALADPLLKLNLMVADVESRIKDGRVKFDRK